MSEPYLLPSTDAFRDRREELAAIGEWFNNDAEWRAMTLYGRRRVGKSWLFRAFAHGRDADIFVASTRALADQLAGFAELLERDGERPVLPDLEAFFRLLWDATARGGRKPRFVHAAAVAAGALARSTAAGQRLGYLVEEAGRKPPSRLAEMRPVRAVRLRPGDKRRGPYSTRWRVYG